MKSNIEIVITDLDKTLFNTKRKFSQKDLNTLQNLKGKTKRVIATGRSYFSAEKVC